MPGMFGRWEAVRLRAPTGSRPPPPQRRLNCYNRVETAALSPSWRRCGSPLSSFLYLCVYVYRDVDRGDKTRCSPAALRLHESVGARHEIMSFFSVTTAHSSARGELKKTVGAHIASVCLTDTTELLQVQHLPVHLCIYIYVCIYI